MARKWVLTSGYLTVVESGPPVAVCDTWEEAAQAMLAYIAGAMNVFARGDHGSADRWRELTLKDHDGEGATIRAYAAPGYSAQVQERSRQ